jgi:hypothetical protein
MSSYQQELIELAKEISAAEGIPLAAALEVARKELSAVANYAQDWDRMVGSCSPAQPIYRVSAA